MKKKVEWYMNSLVNLHIDNHCNLVGKGHSADQIYEMIKDIPVEVVQMSLYGNLGTSVTYHSENLPELNHPELGDWDTAQVWREAVLKAGKRFHAYINTRGCRLDKTHPHWLARDVEGNPNPFNGGHDMCARPSVDGKGFLESYLLPIIDEISSKYNPGGYWVDGDFCRAIVCYCGNCAAAWRNKTGKDTPPASVDDPDWEEWVRFEMERKDAYKKMMADAMHRHNPDATYSSNHSWKNNYAGGKKPKDARSAPEWVDVLSADLTHGDSIELTRLLALFLSGEEDTGYDIMHLVNVDPAFVPEVNVCDKRSLQKILQLGSVTLACGAPWFLWAFKESIVTPGALERMNLCANFVVDRKDALGLSRSANQTAVLLSEKSWEAQLLGPNTENEEIVQSNRWTLSLQDACYGVDMINEHQFNSAGSRYRTILVVNQAVVSDAALERLETVARNGGTVILCGSALQDLPRLAGVVRGELKEGPFTPDNETDGPPIDALYSVETGDAEVVATAGQGLPVLCRRELGEGAVVYCAVASIELPDWDGLVPWIMRKADVGPMVKVIENAEGRHMCYSLRRKEDKTVLHIVDLTACKDGQRIVTGADEVIDTNAPVKDLSLQIPMPKKPRNVSIVPQIVSVDSSWEDGLLTLTTARVDTHAAVIIEGELDGPLPYCSIDASDALEYAYKYYPESSRRIEIVTDGEAHGHEL